jgi:thiol-disulfide isomerase/thioredoxin
MALLEFFGNGCPHCERMKPLVSRLLEEQKIEVEALEVWENDANAEKMAEFDKGLCGGVPFFYNTETKGFICGQTSYEELERWAKGPVIKGREPSTENI